MRLIRLALTLSLGLGLCGGLSRADDGAGLAPASLSLIVPGGGLGVRLSDDGRIIDMTIGPKHIKRPIAAETMLAGCQREGEVAARQLDGGIEFTKHLLHTATGDRCVLVERLRPTGNSIRWEIEIRGQGKPWSTAVETCVQYPVARTTRFWTTWSDSGLAVPGGTFQGNGGALVGDFGATMAIQYPGWTDPLSPMPLRNTKFYYGAAYYGPAHPDICICPSRTDLFCIPLATFIEPQEDMGLSVALSPDNKLPELTMTTDEEGSLVFSRIYHRIDESKPACFALDLVAHEGGWRGGLRWMVDRYPEYFNPPLPRADRMAGCAAYSADERHFDTTRLHRMAFRSNWKCSEDFPYQGMFLPIDDDHTQWTRWLREPPVEGKGPLVSCGMMNDYGRWMHTQGFYVLNYFNVAEFGNYPDLARPAAQGRERRGPLERLERFHLWQTAIGAPDAQGPPHRRADVRDGPRRSGLRELLAGAGPAAPEAPAGHRRNRHRSHGLDPQLQLQHGGGRRPHVVPGQACPGVVLFLATTDVEAGADDAQRRQGDHRQQSHQAAGPDAGLRRHLLRVRLRRRVVERVVRCFASASR